MAETETMFVKPAAGVAVRKPTLKRELLATEGETVPRDAYWLRRLRDGDVIEADPPAAPKPASAKPATK